MRVLTWLLRAALFLAMMGFALSNTDPVTLRFFGIPDAAWRAPMVVVLFVFFAAGVLVGILAALPSLVRQRRELSGLRREANRQPPPAGVTEAGLTEPVRADVGARGI